MKNVTDAYFRQPESPRRGLPTLPVLARGRRPIWANDLVGYKSDAII